MWGQPDKCFPKLERNIFRQIHFCNVLIAYWLRSIQSFTPLVSLQLGWYITPLVSQKIMALSATLC